MKCRNLMKRDLLGLFQPHRSSHNAVRNQNDIFNTEAARQYDSIGRIEKIEIKYNGKPQNCRLFMNKCISTPYNVAQHMNEWVTKQSALALLNKQTLWDMHRPLEGDCELEFLTFSDLDPYHVNKAFWRACSFILGAVVKEAFSDDIEVDLHSFPLPQISSGSFTYDASLSLDSWKPSLDELRSLSASMVRLSQKCLPMERLQVSEEIAKEIFRDNAFKFQQIPDIAANSGGNIILYRIGSHIDISKGPLVGNTSFIGRCSITAVHQVEKEGRQLYRFQGVALPQGLMLNHFAYRIIEERASKLNLNQPSSASVETKQELMAH